MKVYKLSEILENAESLNEHYESEREFVSLGDYKYIETKYNEAVEELTRLIVLYDQQNRACSKLYEMQ